MKSPFSRALLLLAFGFAPNAFADITIEAPFVRAVPPGMQNSAAFMQLNNSGQQARQLRSASSDIAEKVELHTHTNDNGVMRMRQVEAIEIPAQSDTSLQPGGYHIMLLGLKRPLKVGETINFTLHFANGETKTLNAPVTKMAPRMPSHGSGDMGGMHHHEHHKHH